MFFFLFFPFRYQLLQYFDTDICYTVGEMLDSNNWFADYAGSPDHDFVLRVKCRQNKREYPASTLEFFFLFVNLHCLRLKPFPKYPLLISKHVSSNLEF